MIRLITIIECLISQIIKLNRKMNKLSKLKKWTPISIITRPAFNRNRCNHHRQVTWTIPMLVTRMNVKTIMKTCIMKNRMRMRWTMMLINNLTIIKITRMKKLLICLKMQICKLRMNLIRNCQIKWIIYRKLLTLHNINNLQTMDNCSITAGQL